MQNGETCLYRACHYGYVECIQQIVKHDEGKELIREVQERIVVRIDILLMSLCDMILT